jgi:hypothetical protein
VTEYVADPSASAAVAAAGLPGAGGRP